MKHRRVTVASFARGWHAQAVGAGMADGPQGVHGGASLCHATRPFAVLTPLAGVIASLAWALPARGVDVPFTEHVISNTADWPLSVFATDVDGDGDTDVLSTSHDDDKIVWYESDGGSPPAFTERVISTIADGALAVFATDLDGDGDIDVLSVSEIDDKVAWYESDGLSPPTFTERVISTTAVLAFSVFATDVDGDGDTDVLSASQVDDKIAWYDSDGGSPPTFTERLISTAADNPNSVFATDVDGDGDTDVLSASWIDDKIAWYDSDGGSPPAFTERVISTTADGGISVFATDVDGDGDTDVLSASWLDDKIAWYESDGGLPPTFTERVISTTAVGATSVFATDLDGDGDTDVLSASENDDKIAWYESDGGSPPTFTERVISTTAFAAWSVFATDVDGDGDTDILSASAGNGKIAWYENTTPTCGNGAVRLGEECDDGNTDDGDGCSATCTVEEGRNCSGDPSTCTEVCGDVMIVGSEECDDGNTEDGDGCSATCTVEPGSKCTGEPSVCITDIPAVSDWGLIIMSLLVLAGGTILIARRRATDQTACT